MEIQSKLSYFDLSGKGKVSIPGYKRKKSKAKSQNLLNACIPV